MVTLVGSEPLSSLKPEQEGMIKIASLLSPSPNRGNQCDVNERLTMYHSYNSLYTSDGKVWKTNQEPLTNSHQASGLRIILIIAQNAYPGQYFAEVVILRSVQHSHSFFSPKLNSLNYSCKKKRAIVEKLQH